MASVFTNTMAKLHKIIVKQAFFSKKILLVGKIAVPLHPLKKAMVAKKGDGPFVYRLGREIFIL